MPRHREGASAPVREPANPVEEPKLEGPRLRYLDRVFNILRSPEQNPLGEEINWRGISREVKPYKNGVELSDNIREAVSTFITKKIPALKEKISPLRTLGDKELLEALTHNWFEEIGEEVGGKRREVLLALAAHVVKRIENYAYRKVLADASEKDLEKLNLDADTRDLLIRVLEASIKADPMFIRFMAYAALTPRPPQEALPLALHLPGHEKSYTTAALFAHESRFLSVRFAKIAEEGGAWVNKPGGETFRKYLQALSEFYAEKDADKIMERHQAVETLYGELLRSEFPIIITPATEGYYKEPYFDPELKISVATPEAREEEASWTRVQKAMSGSLDALSAGQFRERMQSQPVRGVVVFGGFGVNITFNAVAQEKPAILIFLNEQMRSNDRGFPELVEKNIGNSAELLGTIPSAENWARAEKISRINTVLHELIHSIFPDDSTEAKRIGGRALTILDEVKAEICYRPLVPRIIEEGAVLGTKEGWAVGMLASSLKMLREQPKGDPYFYAAAYSLNALFEKGAVRWEEGKVLIKDFDLYYQIQQSAAEELLSVYRDPSMNERKVLRWIKEKCAPSEEVWKIRKEIAIH